MKRILIFLALIVFVGVCSLGTVLGQFTIGVESGDWIEYNLEYSGSAPTGFPEWMKIDVLNVKETNITTKLTLQMLDGTTDTVVGNYSLETGVLDLLLIPANLDSGQEFFHPDFGTVIIEGVEELSYCDAKRAVNFATINEIECHWDMVTGILLQSEHSTTNFSQNMIATKTNIWEPQIFGLDSTVFYILTVLTAATIATAVFVALKKR